MELHEVWAALSTERLNCELMFEDRLETGVIISCRLRPWKESSNRQRMLLAGGRTPEEAIVYAYLELLNGRWTDLDWRARASGVGGYEPPTRAPLPRLDARSLLEKTTEARKTLEEYEDTQPTPIGTLHLLSNGREDTSG